MTVLTVSCLASRKVMVNLANGEAVCILDWCFPPKVSDSTALEASYRYLFQKMTGILFRRSFLICVQPDNSGFMKPL